MDLEKKIDFYLKGRFGSGTELTGLERRGKGTHGTGYVVTFSMNGEQRQLIMKSLSRSGFGHDHYADRAQVLLLACSNYNEMEKHVKALDVVGDAPDQLISLKDAGEFYIFMEKADGTYYFHDLDSILERRRLIPGDREKARSLARFLAGLHRRKYSGENAKSLYRRRIRDLVGHGECIMGIVDAYNGTGFAGEEELVAYAEKSMPWWGKLRNRIDRLCCVHGDFHPGNIWFRDRDFTLLDRARGTWGEAADDVTCLGINYIYYAVKDRQAFEGPFVELYNDFIQSYLAETGDYELFDAAAPFFAFRALVIAHPGFYPHDTAETKRRLLNFGRSILEQDRFEPDRVGDYLG